MPKCLFMSKHLLCLKYGTFHVADLRLTVLPLLVTVHFILMKKSRSVDISLLFFPKPGPV